MRISGIGGASLLLICVWLYVISTPAHEKPKEVRLQLQIVDEDGYALAGVEIESAERKGRSDAYGLWSARVPLKLGRTSPEVFVLRHRRGQEFLAAKFKVPQERVFLDKQHVVTLVPALP